MEMGRKNHQPSRLGILWSFLEPLLISHGFFYIGTSRYIQWLKVVPRDVYIYICLYDFTDIAILETSWCFMVTFAGVNEDLKVSLKMFIFIDGCV